MHQISLTLVDTESLTAYNTTLKWICHHLISIQNATNKNRINIA